MSFSCGAALRRRNLQILAFVQAVQYLQPGFVLMENVLDSLQKEDGMYIKWYVAAMLQLGYQTRIGTLLAGHYGVAQGRWRCAAPLPPGAGAWLVQGLS